MLLRERLQRQLIVQRGVEELMEKGIRSRIMIVLKGGEGLMHVGPQRGILMVAVVITMLDQMIMVITAGMEAVMTGTTRGTLLVQDVILEVVPDLNSQNEKLTLTS
eukprot:Gb_30781 [translate_table: standard]